ncbi:MAG: EamA family transporter RarD [Treponema sp.]|nr:EamA family transporter RarD [Treponema sp.]
MNPIKKGILLEVFSYTFWGVMPVYWHLLNFASPLRILGFRITFALIFTALTLSVRGNKTWLNLLTDRKKRPITVLCGVIISVNWGLYIWAVNTGHTIDASLGYYINPLVSVLLALIILREKLSVLQWIAFGFAALGVFLVTLFSGVFPWVALLLAITFGFYGLFKKKNKAGAMEALGAETLAVLPLGLALIVFPPQGFFQLNSPLEWLLLVSCGFVTALPLYTFAKGAKLLPLSAIGFLQFINPTILFFFGIFVFGEEFMPEKLWAFACIWIAVVLYCVSLVRNNRSKFNDTEHTSAENLSAKQVLSK